MELPFLLKSLDLGNAQIFEFILSDCAILDRISDEDGFLKVLVNSDDTRFLLILVEIWPSVMYVLFDICILNDKPLALTAIIQSYCKILLMTTHYAKALKILAGRSDRLGCLPVLLKNLSFAHVAEAQDSMSVAIKAQNLSFCTEFIEIGQVALSSRHLRIAAAVGNLEIFEAIYTEYVKTSHSGYSKPLWLAAKNDHTGMVRILLRHQNLNAKYRRRALLHAARLQSPDVLRLLLSDPRFPQLLSVEEILLQTITYNSVRCFEVLKPLLAADHPPNSLFFAAFKKTSTFFLAELLGLRSADASSPDWWGDVITQCGKNGSSNAISLIESTIIPFSYESLLDGFIQGGRVFAIDSLVKSSRLDPASLPVTKSFLVLGRLMRAFHLFDLSGISAALREVRQADQQLYKALQRQLYSLFTDNVPVLVRFASAPPHIRQSRKKWRVEALEFRNIEQ